MADHELFQLEDAVDKQTSKDLALIWRQLDRLVDIETVTEEK